MDQLAIYLNDRHVGVLSSDKQQRLVFQYALEWIASKDVPPLSLSLPLQEDAFLDELARPFFTNLLPEARVREAVAKKLGISSRNEFALLEALGGECAGAVTLIPKGAPIEKKSGYRLLSPEELRELVRDLPKKPFLAGEAGIRLSLAGAQYKLPVYIEGERVFLTQGTSPSSHIIKPNIEGFEQSGYNEAFCMALANKTGLSVPRSYLMTLPEQLYVVARYDRYRDATGQVVRIHQEDFCQAIGLMAETKYESEGGPSLANCFTLLAQFSTNPALDRKALLDWVVFNYLIHNADAHAKNLSLLLRPDKIRLAPFYDLLSTGVYEGITPRLAMKIGGENRPQWIRNRHWERMAKEIGIGSSLVLRTVKAMAKQIVHSAEEVISQQPAMWRPAPIVGRIQDIILKHAHHAETS